MMFGSYYTPPPKKILETDESLRERLLYVSVPLGDSPTAQRQRARIAVAGGEELDRMAEEYGLKRREL